MGKLLYFFKNAIIKFLNILNTLGNSSKVTCGKNVTFGYKSKVFNVQKNKGRIIIEANSYINGELFIYKHGGNITIGEYCFVGENSRIWSAKSINIGRRVLISHNVSIHDSNDHPIDAKLRHAHFKHILHYGHLESIYLNEKAVIIEDDAWICFGATILKGITIGRGSIISACSVVTKDVPPFVVVAGNPAKIVKHLKPESYIE